MEAISQPSSWSKMAVGVFPLLDLPPELRIKVYEYIATSSKVKIRKAGDRKKTKWPAIVFVSRRLSNEALPVIYMNAKVEAVVEDMDFSNVVNFIRRSASFCFKALGQNKHLMAKFMRFDGHFTSLHNWLDYSFACSLYGAKTPNWKYKLLCKYEENEFKREICQKMLNAMDKCYIAMTRQGNSGP